MTGATVLVWELAGRPEPATAVQFRPAPGTPCAMCGRTGHAAAPAAKTLGTNFTDPAAFARPDSSAVCAACVWACSGKPPATLRMWSIVATPGRNLSPSQPKAFLRDTPGLCLTSRADPGPVARTLAEPPSGPWAVTVAVSGQKHVIPYGRVNHGDRPWTVRMENTDVTADPGTWRTVLAHAASLRQRGHRADDVRDGTPTAVRTRAELDAWRTLAAPLAPYVRSPLIDLALWCCTKATTEEYAHAAPAA